MKWEDVGGLEEVKKSILDTVQVSPFYLLSPYLYINLAEIVNIIEFKNIRELR